MKSGKRILLAGLIAFALSVLLLFLFIPAHMGQVRGVNYSLCYPKTVHFSQVPAEVIEKDFEMMRQAGINTVRTYDMLPDFVLDIAEKKGICVIETVCFPGGWTDFTSPFQLNILQKQAVSNVLKHKGRKCVIAWAIWNDAPFTFGSEKGDVIERYGSETVNSFLKQIYNAVKKTDPSRPVTGSNMIHYEEGAAVGSGFLDFMSFNTYVGLKDWNGTFDAEYADRMVDEALSLSSKFGKPALISEMGYSSFWEKASGMTQRKVVSRQIKAVDKKLIGFLLFEWCDNWNKSGRPDELDNTIEEHWGINDGYRAPKGGYGGMKDSISAFDRLVNRLRGMKRVMLGKKLALDFYKPGVKQSPAINLSKADAFEKWAYLRKLESEENWIVYAKVSGGLLSGILEETERKSSPDSINKDTVKYQYLNWLVHRELMDQSERASLVKLYDMLLRYSAETSNPDILKEYASLLSEKGEPVYSRKLIEEYAGMVVSKFPPEEAADILFNAGKEMKMLKSERLSETSVLFGKYIEVVISENDQHKSCEALFKLGNLYQEKGFYDKAVDVFRLIVDKYPRDDATVEALNRLARIYDFRGQLEKAEYEYSRIIFNYPESSLAVDAVPKMMSIFAKYSHDTRVEKEIPFLEKVTGLNIDKSILVKLTYQLASLYESRRQTEKATACYKKVIDEFPDSSYASFAEKDLERLKVKDE
ncbi:MAG: tetratricopeptide repeat protein [Candidatus Aureabacteria bacterium]|nr:tetratricopeptide repeat protein [Candidatus Auribacterota bacterium]